VGGGSGGHITPIVAVVNEIKKHDKKSEIRVWCDRKFSGQARELLGAIVRVDIIASGKWRRYANLNFFHKYFSFYHITHTHIPNFIDLIKITFAIFQSFIKLIAWRPDVIFLKGGFVCLPVGLAAHVLRIPTVIHDSDTTPGLTNRILARYATAIAVGSPIENYPQYPKKITKFVGVPIRDGIREFSATEQRTAKEKLGFGTNKELVLVVGGGLGAVSTNEVVVKIATLITKNNAQILLVAGKGNAAKLEKHNSENMKIVEFLTDDYLTALAAGDIVVTRAGATTMAELAAAHKAVIIIPNSHLAGDHQTKNALAYEKADAAIVVKQDLVKENPEILEKAILKLLANRELRQKLSRNLAKFARPNAINDIVDMILRVRKGK